jgi:hypothetical protein
MDPEHKEHLLEIKIKQIQDELRKNYEQRSFLNICLSDAINELALFRSKKGS